MVAAVDILHCRDALIFTHDNDMWARNLINLPFFITISVCLKFTSWQWLPLYAELGFISVPTSNRPSSWLNTVTKCLFGWREFWVISSCFHNSWSKTGGVHGRSLVWTPKLMIRDSVSITQFSDFWVMSYGNWKHILAIFSFHNS